MSALRTSTWIVSTSPALSKFSWSQISFSPDMSKMWIWRDKESIYNSLWLLVSYLTRCFGGRVSFDVLFLERWGLFSISSEIGNSEIGTLVIAHILFLEKNWTSVLCCVYASLEERKGGRSVIVSFYQPSFGRWAPSSYFVHCRRRQASRWPTIKNYPCAIVTSFIPLYFAKNLCEIRFSKMVPIFTKVVLNYWKTSR